MRTLRVLLFGTLSTAVWPAYLGLLAYTTRQAPWPKTLAVPLAAALGLTALALFVIRLSGWSLRSGGWAHETLGMPEQVTRQLRAAIATLVVVHLLFLLPAFLISEGYLSNQGRPTSAPSVVRLLIVSFEIAVLAIAFRLMRKHSALVVWLHESPVGQARQWQYRRAFRFVMLAAILGVIGLDATGYSYSARRLANGAVGSLAAVTLCWGFYRVLIRAIDRHSWAWLRLTRSLKRHQQTAEMGLPDDLAGRLRQLSRYCTLILGLVLAAWVWDIDMALFQFVGGLPLWTVNASDELYVTVGDLTRAVVIMALTSAAWMHMSTFFAVAVFPRIRDDPGIRFAMVTLCRYAVLGVGLLAALSAIHMGVEKIGMVLAALGVGLGFGLQEIVSNFICGIILLLERPIRVGDTVTVSGMTGRVDRINIRATTIHNGDNQSIIVPNRAFITGDLINWTLKDRIVRIGLRVKVAPGTDPDRVAELLLTIAREDPDVLRTPAPSALMEEFSDSALIFSMSVHVPDPGLSGRVRHRLYSQIQRRFEEAGIQIPLPTQALLVRTVDGKLARGFVTSSDVRIDPASPTPSGPWLAASARPTPDAIAATPPPGESERGSI